jgi:hypothetical protein
MPLTLFIPYLEWTSIAPFATNSNALSSPNLILDLKLSSIVKNNFLFCDMWLEHPETKYLISLVPFSTFS